MRIVLIILYAVIGIGIAFSLGIYVGVRTIGTFDESARTAALGDAAEKAASGANAANGVKVPDQTAPGTAANPQMADDKATDDAQPPSNAPSNPGDTTQTTAPSPTAGEKTSNDSNGRTASGGGTKNDESTGETGPEPLWVQDLLGSLRAPSEAAAGGQSAGNSDAAAGMAANTESQDEILAVAPQSYAVQTRRAIPAKRARALANRFTRPPLTPRVIPGTLSGNGESGPSFVRFTGFDSRESAEKAMARLTAELDVALAVVRVASRPRAKSDQVESN